MSLGEARGGGGGKEEEEEKEEEGKEVVRKEGEEGHEDAHSTRMNRPLWSLPTSAPLGRSDGKMSTRCESGAPTGDANSPWVSKGRRLSGNGASQRVPFPRWGFCQPT